jgi:hypothetical protein
MHPTATSNCMLVIERENSGQSDYGVVVLESIQIKAILNLSLKSF